MFKKTNGLLMPVLYPTANSRQHLPKKHQQHEYNHFHKNIYWKRSISGLSENNSIRVGGNKKVEQ